MSDNFAPQLAGFYLGILGNDGISDNIEYSLSKHEFPFSNRNIIINTGKKVPTYSFRCVFQDNTPFFGTDALPPTYDNHITFREIIDSGFPLVFTHPTYGQMEGFVEVANTIRREEQRYIEFDITFAEQISEVVTNFDYSIEEVSANELRKNSLANQIKVQGLLQINDTPSFRARLNRFIDKLESFFSDIIESVDSIVNTIEYFEDLAGDVVLAVSNTVERIVNSIASIQNIAANFINSLIINLRNIRNLFLNPDGTSTIESIIFGNIAAARLSYESATQYKTDDDNRSEILKNVGKRTFDNNSRYIGIPNNLTAMNISELEQTSQDIRAYINDVVQDDRDNPELETQAREIQQYIDHIKVKRERVITVKTVTIALFDLMNRYGISYQRINEIMALNPEIRNPNFVEGEVKLLVSND
jgi:prophage DNA circulation protein